MHLSAWSPVNSVLPTSSTQGTRQDHLAKTIGTRAAGGTCSSGPFAYLSGTDHFTCTYVPLSTHWCLPYRLPLMCAACLSPKKHRQGIETSSRGQMRQAIPQAVPACVDRRLTQASDSATCPGTVQMRQADAPAAPPSSFCRARRQETRAGENQTAPWKMSSRKRPTQCGRRVLGHTHKVLSARVRIHCTCDRKLKQDIPTARHKVRMRMQSKSTSQLSVCMHAGESVSPTSPFGAAAPLWARWTRGRAMRPRHCNVTRLWVMLLARPETPTAEGASMYL